MMWRWIVRAYISFMLFWVLLFGAFVSLKELSRLLAYTHFPGIFEWAAAHVLIAAFLAGLIAGQVPVDSRFTGERWFRSKDGSGFENLKLEKLRPWTWLAVTPIAVLGIGALFLELHRSVLSGLTLSSFLSDLVSKNCANVWTRRNWFDTFCNVQSVLLAPWVASIGYSISPFVQRRTLQFSAVLRNRRDASDVQAEHSRD
jgi:hypothetical protein